MNNSYTSGVEKKMEWMIKQNFNQKKAKKGEKNQQVKKDQH